MKKKKIYEDLLDDIEAKSSHNDLLSDDENTSSALMAQPDGRISS